ncbi:G-protein coupled receptor 54-like [Haliotis rufescens]|uniref:G-protein coupled receptor 54-like n=1 Tax=Haliotis rufescens TaxID=6454 RepID=UPI00201F3529|nr:G-protein coupled receptor 54-like [Haliotis rufescens]
MPSYDITANVSVSAVNVTVTEDSSMVTALHVMLITVIWGIIIAVGSLGNLIVIYVMCCHGDRSATSYFVINLAIADFAFMTIVVSLTTSMYGSLDWLYGNNVCKLTQYMIHVNLLATCLTLTAMTVDRYFAIVHPIRSIRSRTPQVPIFINIGIWLASFSLSTPYILYYRVVTDYYRGPRVYCKAEWPDPRWQRGVTVAVVMATYVLPLTVIILCYTLILKHLWKNKVTSRRDNDPHPVVSEGTAGNTTHDRRRRKVAKMVAIVVILFASLWFPIHAFSLAYHFHPHFPKTQVLYNIKIIAHTLSFFNSCVNPFVYAFMGDGFRRAFRKSFPSCIRRNRIIPWVASEAGHSAMNDTRMTETFRSRSNTQKSTKA